MTTRHPASLVCNGACTEETCLDFGDPSQVRLFDEDRDLPLINRWLAARNEKFILPGALPRIGYIAPGFAVSFLYQTDTPLCMFHAQITNPAAPGKDRFRAYRACQRACGIEALRLGYKVWCGWTSNATVVSVAMSRGARAEGPVTFLSGVLAPDPEVA